MGVHLGVQPTILNALAMMSLTFGGVALLKVRN